MKSSFTTNFQASAPWLQAILNDYQDAVFITDVQFNVLNWNTSAERLCRQPANKLASGNFLAILQQLFPGQPLISRQLREAFIRDEAEDFILAGPTGEMFQLSCYADKLPGTQYLLDIVIIIRNLETSI